MRRTFDVDVLECLRCKGRLRVLAVIDDRDQAAQILDELSIPCSLPPARACDLVTLIADPTIDPAC